MCPLCDESNGCPYWYLADVCMFVKLAFLFDHPGTVFYAIFVSFWGQQNTFWALFTPRALPSCSLQWALRRIVAALYRKLDSGRSTRRTQCETGFSASLSGRCWVCVRSIVFSCAYLEMCVRACVRVLRRRVCTCSRHVPRVLEAEERESGAPLGLPRLRGGRGQFALPVVVTSAQSGDPSVTRVQ